MEKRRLSQEQLLNRALYFIGFRPRSRKEAEQKLKLLGASPEECAFVLASLEEHGLIDDEKILRPILKEYLENKGLGLGRVKTALALKGFHPHLIEDALAEYQEENGGFSEDAAALALLERKYSSPPLDDAKALGFLGRRGFSYAAAAKALNTYKKNREE